MQYTDCIHTAARAAGSFAPAETVAARVATPRDARSAAALTRPNIARTDDMVDYVSELHACNMMLTFLFKAHQVREQLARQFSRVYP